MANRGNGQTGMSKDVQAKQLQNVGSPGAKSWQSPVTLCRVHEKTRQVLKARFECYPSRMDGCTRKEGE